MPLAAKRKRPDPDAIYVAWESVCLGSLPGAPVVRRGTRLRGNDPIVQAAGEWFLPDGTDDREVQRRRAEYQAQEFEANQPPPPPPPPSRLRDEDLLVAVRPAGVRVRGEKTVDDRGRSLFVHAGERVSRDHPAAKADPDGFVSVTRDVPRSEAVVAQQKLSSYNPDRDELRVVHAGQWLHRSDPLARANPHQVRAAEPFTP